MSRQYGRLMPSYRREGDRVIVTMKKKGHARPSKFVEPVHLLGEESYLTCRRMGIHVLVTDKISETTCTWCKNTLKKEGRL